MHHQTGYHGLGKAEKNWKENFAGTQNGSIKDSSLASLKPLDLLDRVKVQADSIDATLGEPLLTLTLCLHGHSVDLPGRFYSRPHCCSRQQGDQRRVYRRCQRGTESRRGCREQGRSGCQCSKELCFVTCGH